MVRFSPDQYFSQTQYFIFKQQKLFTRLRNTHNPSSYNDVLLQLSLPFYTRIRRFLISLLIHDHLFDDSADRARNVFASTPFLHVVTCVSTSFTWPRNALLSYDGAGKSLLNRWITCYFPLHINQINFHSQRGLLGRLSQWRSPFLPH